MLHRLLLLNYLHYTIHRFRQLFPIIREILQVFPTLLLQRPDLSNPAVENLFHRIQFLEVIDITERSAQYRHMASKAVVLFYDHLCRHHSAPQRGYSAKSVEFTGQFHLAAETLDNSVRQKFKHECFAIADAKVIEADVDLILRM